MTFTFDPQINRAYLLAKTNATVKFEGEGSMSYRDIVKEFLPIRLK
jgi:hypothetical protein